MIKFIKVDPSEILSYISKMMQILFINKSNQIVFVMKSKIKNLFIDIHMFKYLICYMSLKLHDKN